MDLHSLKQDADTAIRVTELGGDRLRPEIREDIEMHVRLTEEEYGALSLEFTQGFFAGVKFLYHWFTDMPGANAGSIAVTEQLMIAFAYEYLKKVDEATKKT